MKHILIIFFAIACLHVSLAEQSTPSVLPPYYEIRYSGSTNEGELKLGVTYTLWIPPGVKVLRGVIVHQHGCGEGACRGGETAAYDLHWQALARKWSCALLGPSYHQAEKDNCAWWCDPRQGSGETFLRALAHFARGTAHPEIERVPWALWGHSGGANWVGTMLILHPERIVAVWLRSGSPRLISGQVKGGIPAMPAASYKVPVMCNLGIREKQDRFAGLWNSTLAFFQDFRTEGALAGLAIDPRTSHECGDSRYLAIPWFDASLALRLPTKAGGPLRDMPVQDAWIAPMFGDNPQAARVFTNDLSQSVWLPNRAVAQAWREYIKTGATTDSTPPPAPKYVVLQRGGELTWDAEADFQSGLSGFIVERDGIEIARLPQKAEGPFGRPLFQKMSYHDTPEKPLPQMRYTDVSATPGVRHRYTIRSVNSCDLISSPAAAKRR